MALTKDLRPLVFLAKSIGVRFSHLLLIGLLVHGAAGLTRSQSVSKPRTIVIHHGTLKLRALLWLPRGRGPFPAVQFSVGSGQNPSPQILGPRFARHGYVFLSLFRQGQGLSADQGEESSIAVRRERAANGDDAANRLQLRLLENEELGAEISGLEYLRSLPNVDPQRVAIVGHSFGGSLALLLAEYDKSLRAVISFGGAAASWPRSSYLRDRLMTAANNLITPVFFIYTANDYSVTAGEVLAAALARQGKPHRLKIFPAFGKSTAEGHNLIYLAPSKWEREVFEFLDQHLSSAKSTRRS